MAEDLTQGQMYMHFSHASFLLILEGHIRMNSTGTQ